MRDYYSVQDLCFAFSKICVLLLALCFVTFVLHYRLFIFTMFFTGKQNVGIPSTDVPVSCITFEDTVQYSTVGDSYVLCTRKIKITYS